MSLSDTSGAFYRFFSAWNGNRQTYAGASLEKLYARNELAFACINKIADVMNDAELTVEKLNSKNEWETIKAHPALSLLEKPNSEEIGEDFRRKMVQSENFAGLCYIRLIRPRPQAAPVGLYILNPNRVMPQMDYSQNRIVEYRYTNPAGMPQTIAPEDILIRRRADLTEEFYGLAPLAVAANTIDGDEALTDYVNSFFDGADGTAGIPAGILKFKRTISPEFAEMKRKLWKKNTKASEIQVLDDEADFQVLGAKLNELASDSIRWQNEAKICGIFGVPPILVGAYVGLRFSNQRAGVKEALTDFWYNKISPELKVLRKWLTWNFLPLFEDAGQIKAGRIRFNYDLTQMLALQEDLSDLHARARANFSAGGWTLNEFRDATGKKPDPKGDYYLQPFNLEALTPENRALTAAQKIEQGTDPTETAPEDSQKTLLSLKTQKTPEKKTFEFEGLTLSREPTAAEKLIDLKSLVSDLDAQTEQINKSLMRFRDALIDQAARNARSRDDRTIHALTLDRDEPLSARIQASLTEAFEKGRDQIEREIGAQRNEKRLPHLETKKTLEEKIREKLKGVSDNLISKILNEIQSRAINLWVALKLLDFAGEEFFDELKKRLFGESDKFVENISKAGANLAISAGRNYEISERRDEWNEVEYSAILDKNLCENCKRWDGKRSKNPEEELPQVPNAECLGATNCRCFWITILD